MACCQLHRKSWREGAVMGARAQEMLLSQRVCLGGGYERTGREGKKRGKRKDKREERRRERMIPY